MITNDKQYRSTRVLAEKLRNSLVALESQPSTDIHPMFISAQKSALASQLQELENDVAGYDALRSGAISVFEASTLRDLPKLLISARIARGMSQKELGAFIGVHEQQIQRYESERYRSASLERMVEVADALGVKVSERGELIGDERLQSVDFSDFSSFPIAEMYKRGYFEDFEGTLLQARKAADVLIPAFFRDTHSRWTPAALHRRSVRAKGVVHESALAAWEVRVVSLADRDPPSVIFDPGRVTTDWLRGLLSLSAEPTGITEVSRYLRDIGIVLITEAHLPGTLLDGAALRTPNNVHVVALTLRHDRLDNFWFTLLHEIGHLVLHVGPGGFVAIFDNNDVGSVTEIEQQADVFAQEASISEEAWNSCVSRFTRTEKAVRRDAEQLGISPAIVAGRIRKDANNYTLLASLVGAGEVRKHFRY